MPERQTMVNADTSYLDIISLLLKTAEKELYGKEDKNFSISCCTELIKILRKKSQDCNFMTYSEFKKPRTPNFFPKSFYTKEQYLTQIYIDCLSILNKNQVGHGE